MKTWLPIILGFVGGVAVTGLVVVGLIVGGLLYIQKAGADSDKAHQMARDAGAAFGRGTDQEGCISRTLDLEESFVGPYDAPAFVSACLSESRETPNFCDGVPSARSDYNWPKETCVRIGRDTKQCEAAYYEKKYFCEKRNKK